MFDFLPFPNINGETEEKKIAQISTYLIQLKEAIEFAMRGMSDENKSVANALAKALNMSNETREDEVAQVSSRMSKENGDVETLIKQTAEDINLEIAKKVGVNEVISKINLSQEGASIKANKISLEGTVTANENFKVLKDGSIEAKNGKFSGTINGGAVNIKATNSQDNPYIYLEDPKNSNKYVEIWNDGIVVTDLFPQPFDESYGTCAIIRTEVEGGFAELNGSEVNAFSFNNMSLASRKKNFEELKNAFDIIDAIDVYRYHYKNETDSRKKHIGLVIGDGFNYSKEVTSADDKSVDLYALTGVCLQAIKELAQVVEAQDKRIKALEEKS